MKNNLVTKEAQEVLIPSEKTVSEIVLKQVDNDNRIFLIGFGEGTAQIRLVADIA